MENSGRWKRKWLIVPKWPLPTVSQITLQSSPILFLYILWWCNYCSTTCSQPCFWGLQTFLCLLSKKLGRENEECRDWSLSEGCHQSTKVMQASGHWWFLWSCCQGSMEGLGDLRTLLNECVSADLPWYSTVCYLWDGGFATGNHPKDFHLGSVELPKQIVPWINLMSSGSCESGDIFPHSNHPSEARAGVSLWLVSGVLTRPFPVSISLDLALACQWLSCILLGYLTVRASVSSPVHGKQGKTVRVSDFPSVIVYFCSWGTSRSAGFQFS